MLIFLSKCRISLFELSSFNVSCNCWKSQKFYIPAALSSVLRNVHNILVKSANSENHSLICRYVQVCRVPQATTTKVAVFWNVNPRNWCKMTGISNGTSFSSFEQKNYQKEGRFFYRKYPYTAIRPHGITSNNTLPSGAGLYLSYFRLWSQGRCHRCDMF